MRSRCVIGHMFYTTAISIKSFILVLQNIMKANYGERVAVFHVRAMTNSPQRPRSARRMLLHSTSLSIPHVDKIPIVPLVAALAPVVRVLHSP